MKRTYVLQIFVLKNTHNVYHFYGFFWSIQSCYNTLSKVQKIRVILRRSENTFHLLQWLSMGKQFLKFKKLKKTFVPKIILHNYILYKGDPTYVAISPVDSGMHQIFTDFQHST